MDAQYRPSDLAAQMGTSNMQQQTQDVYWIQPPQFNPLDQHMFLGLQFVQQPTATAGAPSQQAQAAVTMASAMWKHDEYRFTTTEAYGLSRLQTWNA